MGIKFFIKSHERCRRMCEKGVEEEFAAPAMSSYGGAGGGSQLTAFGHASCWRNRLHRGK